MRGRGEGEEKRREKKREIPWKNLGDKEYKKNVDK